MVTDLPDSSDPEPRAPTPRRGDMSVRVADAERDRAVTQLREHAVEGRLTLDEFTQRVGLALQARTQGDLHAAMADLPEVAVPEEVSTRRPARRSFVAVMSGSRAKGRWRVGARTTAVAVMGGCEMDLRQAEIEGPEVVITAVAFWGGVHVIVPEGIDVQLEGFSFMGGRNLKVRDVPIVPGSPRIRVRGYAVMGGINIRSRSSRSGREIAPDGRGRRARTGSRCARPSWRVLGARRSCCTRARCSPADPGPGGSRSRPSVFAAFRRGDRHHRLQ